MFCLFSWILISFSYLLIRRNQITQPLSAHYNFSTSFTKNIVYFKKYIYIYYLFGCVGSWFGQVRSFVSGHGLSSCDGWAQYLWHSDLLALGTWDLNSLTQDGTLVRCVAGLSLNPWIIREVPPVVLFNMEKWNSLQLTVHMGWS